MSNVSIHVDIFNHTNEDMNIKDAHLEHGKWLDRPESIASDREGDFGAENGRFHDIEGSVSWYSKKTHDDFTIDFDKPVQGTTRFSVHCSDRYRYTISGDPLERNAIVSVSFYNQDFH